MKVTAVARAQSVESLPANFFAATRVFDLVDAVRDRYEFRNVPTAQELLSPQPNQPVNFIWGKREIGGRSITVESLQILNYATIATSVTVVTRASTDDSDLVVEDLKNWVESTFRLEPTAIFPRSYLSQLEFILESSIPGRLEFLKSTADSITSFIKSYGFKSCPNYEPTALFFFFDNTKLTNPPTLAGAFSVDRRGGAPYEQNRFFSQAPLKTQHHIAVLQEFERALSIS